MLGVVLLFKAFWAPGEALFKASKNVKSAWVPILLLMAVALTASVVIFTHVNVGEATLRMMDQSGRGRQLSPEQRANVARVTDSPMAHNIGAATATIGPLLVITVVAVVYFGLFTLIGREGSFSQFWAVTAFAFAPALVRNIAGIATVLIVPSSQIMLDEIGNIGPSVFVDRTAVSNKLFTAAAQLDVISIWILTLLIIGYGFLVLKGVSALTRSVCVVLVFLIYVSIRIALA